ncbi:MAG: hypothetical protein CVU06_02935 [Bacteroidetes bacterium HGW-Bacteroidetes-22]|nr:MAG: hypothetical protein CVU06_02935 [Bacteroidetes bacterium HGW-Bacteroidetes-22]
MEQKDFILREIEKIGMIISAIRQKFFGEKQDQSVPIEKQLVDLKEMLVCKANFDLDKFMSLNIEGSNEYISSFKGFSVENIEYLADCISEICCRDSDGGSKKYLEKTLELYELCNLKSRTYSLEREMKIETIKNTL